MTKVFISYAREWHRTAELVYDQLQVAGCRPWLDKRDLLPGQPWDETITEAIRGCDVFLVCLSRQFATTDRYLNTELDAALASERPLIIIPVKLEPEAFVPPKLQSAHWDEFYLPGGIHRLLDSISSQTGIPLTPPPLVFTWKGAAMTTADFSADLLREMEDTMIRCLCRIGDFRPDGLAQWPYEEVFAKISTLLGDLKGGFKHDIEVTCLDQSMIYVLHPWSELVGASFSSQWIFAKGQEFVEWFHGTLRQCQSGHLIWLDQFNSSSDMEMEMLRNKWKYQRKTIVLFSRVHVAKDFNWHLVIEGHEIFKLAVT